MLRTTLSRPTSLSTTASPSLLSWTPSRPSHAEATQPRDASSLRTPWTRLHCHPNPTTPACQPWSTMRACCCEKRPAGHGACTARPPCLPGAPRRIRPAWPGSMAELSSDGGRWPSTLGEQLAGHHARPKKQVLWGRGLVLRREPPQSACNCRELVCCHVQRPQQHEGLWLLFLFHFLHFHFNGFPSFHCAVDASSPYSSSPRGSVRGHDREKSSATLQARQGERGRSPGLRPRAERHEWDCTRALFLCCVDRRARGWIPGLQGPRGLHGTGGQGGYKPFCTNATHLPVWECVAEELAGPTCWLRHVTCGLAMLPPWGMLPGFQGQPCLLPYPGVFPPLL